MMPSPNPARTLIFDACNVGAVLRALLFVQVTAAVGLMFGAPSWQEWGWRLALLMAATLPATLLWLLATCSLKALLARRAQGWQYAAALALGGLAGLLACAMLWWIGLDEPTPWLAGACSGVLLAAVLTHLLVLRARASAPAATQARLAELQARIRPHFLFNTLNSAIALVRAEPDRAERLLEDLSELFRQALADPGTAVTLAQEITLTERYLAIEQVRFGSRLRVEWALDPCVAAALLPPLLLQPLVENAVLHGVESSSLGSTVRIRSYARNGLAWVEIDNSVPPQSTPSGGQGMALANVRDRLHLLHDLHGQFSAKPYPGGFRVRIGLPLPSGGNGGDGDGDGDGAP